MRRITATGELKELYKHFDKRKYVQTTILVVGLIIIAILLLFEALNSPSQTNEQAFFLNLATEIGGAVLTFLLIDYFWSRAQGKVIEKKLLHTQMLKAQLVEEKISEILMKIKSERQSLVEIFVDFQQLDTKTQITNLSRAISKNYRILELCIANVRFHERLSVLKNILEELSYEVHVPSSATVHAVDYEYRLYEVEADLRFWERYIERMQDQVAKISGQYEVLVITRMIDCQSDDEQKLKDLIARVANTLLDDQKFYESILKLTTESSDKVKA